MTLTYQEILLNRLQRQNKFNHLADYHTAGYKGKGIVILNCLDNASHTAMTTKVINDCAPEATVIIGQMSTKGNDTQMDYANVIIEGETIQLEEAIDRYNIKIINRSFGEVSTSKAVLAYFRDLQKRKGVIFVNSAGNSGSDGVDGIYTADDTAIAVGVCYLTDSDEVKLYSYSSQGEELDFVTFPARGEGTSAASPNLAAQIACLLNKYGDFNQEECVKILKSISFNLGDPGKNVEYGWGLPILPLTEKLEILEKLRGAEEMQFKDVEDTRWSKAAIDRCVEEGLLVGFEDGTFRPTEHVTREQFAMILTRILDKIEGRI